MDPMDLSVGMDEPPPFGGSNEVNILFPSPYIVHLVPIHPAVYSIVAFLGPSQ